VNSKEIVAAVSAVALVVILAYPALATGGVSAHIGSTSIKDAEHVYVTVGDVWVHRSGQSGSEGWQLISNQSQSVDLVSLASARTDLGKGQIALGSYDMVKIEISNITWVFNDTTTTLQLESSEVQSSVELTVQAGRESVITLTLSGYQQVIGGTRFFTPTLAATVG